MDMIKNQFLSYTKQKNGAWNIFEKMNLPSLLYASKQVIYLQGEDAERLYYLKKGCVRIFISSEQGTEKTLSILKAGALFGEAAFFEGLPRTSCASTLEKSEIIAINRRDLLNTFEKNPDLAIDMLKYLSRTIRMLSIQVDHMTFLQADKRLAKMLISLSEHCKVYATHEELASLIGVSRVTVSKLLIKFVKNQWIRTQYRCIVIRNLVELQKFAFENESFVGEKQP